jgi:hypothetical protein
MLDYVAVSKEWIFSGVGFSVVVAIIFVVRSILNRHRSDGSISTRLSPRNRRDIGKRPPVRRILPFLSIGYVIYALLIAWFICRLLFRVYRAQSAGQMQLSGIQAGCRSLWPQFLPSLSLAYVFASHCSFQHGAGDAARWCLPAFRVSLFLSARF